MVFVAGAPSQIQVISPRQGKDAYSYNMVWANPKTGGRPIEKYRIRMRQVNKMLHAGAREPLFYRGDQGQKSIFIM